MNFKEWAKNSKWDFDSSEYAKEIKNIAKADWDAAQANSSSGHAIQTSPDVSVLIGALESITEYWNGDNNQCAMHDACQHAVETACDALNAYRQQGGEA